LSVDIVPYPHIRELREQSGLSQSEVAEILACSQVAYSYYEIGRRDIPTEILIKLAKLFNTTTDYLLGLSNEKKR
jgi:transcriptional regulator with XRE-family HTH domain